MPRIDDVLKSELSRKDRELLEKLGDEPGLFELTAEVYRGKMRGWNILATVYTFVFTGLMFWFLYELLTAEEALAAVKWMAGFLFAAVATGLLKMWFWMRLNHLAALREIKRVELLLAGRD